MVEIEEGEEGLMVAGFWGGREGRGIWGMIGEGCDEKISFFFLLLLLPLPFLVG